ncbi:DUF2142 domain-containing protein [Acetobacter sp. AN02]|uniref:DUF2142 domain-containing protein n=1 Tax=Acetobacter sp. AN02 TaxID=2894186 RepID=UPI0024343C3A|nr:DUF2142 domain-containing protein [Acetobacter sp. AN02]MDG6094461.1 DUF2142 domain-containing protein [Acetobacter sp. AN02]
MSDSHLRSFLSGLSANPGGSDHPAGKYVMKAAPGLWYEKISTWVVCFYTGCVFIMGLALAGQATPISGIDEEAHFKRALMISEGIFFAPRFGPNDWGGELDTRILGYTDWFHERMFHTSALAAGREEAGVLALKLSQEPRRFRRESFPSTASYAPVPYLPAAAGLLISRISGASVDVQFMAGRVLNIIFYSISMFFVYYLMPRFKLLALAVLTTPTAVHLSASYSADPVSNILAALFVAYWLRLFLNEAGQPLRVGQMAALSALAFLLCMTKIPFIILILQIIFIPLHSGKSRWNDLAVKAVMTGIPVAGGLAWNAAYPFVPGRYWGSGADPHATLQLLFHHPLIQTKVLMADIRDHLWSWWVDGFSRFCTGPLPYYFVVDGAVPVIGFAALAGICLTEGGALPRRWPGVLLICSGLAFALLNLIAFKVGFAPPGAAYITGLQGRYFIPAWLCVSAGIGLLVPGRLWLRSAAVLCFAVYAGVVIRVFAHMMPLYTPWWH